MALGILLFRPAQPACACKTIPGYELEIAPRPTPNNADPDNLLPPDVGQFQRGPVAFNAGALMAQYTDSTNTLQAQARLYPSVTEAQQAVTALVQSDVASSWLSDKVGDDLFADQDNQSLPTHIVYNRGRYFFYIVGESGDALKRFILQYPY